MAPSIRSANAILITRNKLFLRRLLFTAKRITGNKFPPTMKTSANTKAMQNAIPSALKGKSFVGCNEDVLFEAVIDDPFFIFHDLSELDVHEDGRWDGWKLNVGDKVVDRHLKNR